MPRPNTTGGRVQPHQRDTNDNVQIIGGDLAVLAAHADAVNTKTALRMNDGTHRNYRNRTKRMIVFWQEKYPDYFENGTRIIPTEELADKTKHHHRNDRDIRYEGLNVKMVTAFMGANKFKADGKLYGFSDMRKYHDAILWGAKMTKQKLPMSYYQEIAEFLDSFKNEYTKEKQAGNTDENDSDPISFQLYRLLCKWAAALGLAFVWVWTTLQWNLMARAISIDPLAFHHVQLGPDCFIFKHDSTKADKKGEKSDLQQASLF